MGDSLTAIEKVIEKAIDKACGYNPKEDGWKKPRKTNSHDEQVAIAISQNAIGHIDQMYPDMWKGVPTTARRSLGNSIYNDVLKELSFYKSND